MQSGNESKCATTAEIDITVWNHITVTITPNIAECLTIYSTKWDSNIGSTPTQQMVQTTGVTDNVPKTYNLNQDIIIGDDTNISTDQFDGRLVDVRYYPQKTLV